MLKKFQLIVLLTLFLSSGLLAQEVILSDEFDNGDGLWNSGWIDAGNTTVTVSVDASGVLSGANSYKLAVVEGSNDTYRIQRNANCPLLAGNVYTISFMAVADRDVTINVLFEMAGDPYSKSFNELVDVTTTAQTFTYDVAVSNNVPTNQLKFHFGGPDNDNYTIWIDAISVTETPDPAMLTQWGAINRYGWPIIPSEAPGSAGMGGAAHPQGAWATLRGGFDPITLTGTEAIVATGKLEIIGGDMDSWGPIRFGIFNNTNAGVLNYANTDSARWGTWNNAGTDSASFTVAETSTGYMFTPRSGTNDPVSGGGGNGSMWSVNGGSFLSTWSGGTQTMGVINNAPARAELTEGVYNWAVSVQPQSDGTTEVRWYLEKQDRSYWIGGTAIDTLAQKTVFNGLVFGVNNGNGIENTTVTGLSLSSVKVEKGEPITVTERPWQAYYLEDWGAIGRYGWPIIPGDVVGNAGIGGTAHPQGNWASLRGEFLEPYELSGTNALIVKGKFEIVGGDMDSWGPIRFGVYNHTGAGVLNYANTDSARWGTWSNPGTDSASFAVDQNGTGYMFSPRSGTNDQTSGNGGNGSMWSVNGGSWLSSWSGGTQTMGVINNAPARAKLTAGTYEWAVSIQKQSDGKNEVRWYVQKEDRSYWIGGTTVDTLAEKTVFNGVVFGVNNGNGMENSTVTGLNLMDVQVDRGAPIVVPERPWQAYYLEDWGAIGRYGWPIIPGDVVGNAGMGGAAHPQGNWASLRGEFLEPYELSGTNALIVKGKFEIVGGDMNSWGPIRFGVYNHTGAGVLNYANTDSARWGTWSNPGTDSASFAVDQNGTGYMFSPRSGTNDQTSGNGGNGSMWSVNGGSWLSSWSGGTQTMGVVNNAPARAQLTAGTYDWAVSIQRQSNGKNEVKWYVQKEDRSYWIGGTTVDTLAEKTVFNGVVFGVNNGNGMENSTVTGLNLVDVQVDRGAPIVIPEAPWQPYYIENFGIISNRNAGWEFTPGEVIGNASVSGEAYANGYVTIHADFVEPFTPSVGSKALILRGKMNFVGGGFGAWSSLRLGVFNTATRDNENNQRGYLFMPLSGETALPTWFGIEEQGTIGAVNNPESAWFLLLGQNDYIVSSAKQDVNATATAGVYDFAFSFAPQTDGSMQISYSISKPDLSYIFSGRVIDDNTPLVTQSFNVFNLAFNTQNNSTTAIELIDVQVDRGDPIDIVSDIEDINSDAIPTEYNLSQNYPNPFNPTTTIEFALPKAGSTSLVVYDILGRKVTELVNGEFQAGYHKINFDASKLSSGVYIYTISSGDFVSTKKLMLLK